MPKHRPIAAIVVVSGRPKADDEAHQPRHDVHAATEQQHEEAAELQHDHAELCRG